MNISTSDFDCHFQSNLLTLLTFVRTDSIFKDKTRSRWAFDYEINQRTQTQKLDDYEFYLMA